MKKIVFLCFMVSFLIGNCTQQTPKFPQGAWKLVSSQGTNTDSSGKLISVDFHPIATKMWSEKNFSFIGQWKQDTIIRDFYGGGTYTLNGNRYVEKVIYHFDEPKTILDWDFKALLEFKNDTLIQTYPVDENWQIDNNNCYVEKYIQLR